ncbi:hypothetical protein METBISCDRAFT_12337 [Metschnikowia bicuspidata]|uniref:DNA helicase n=1 Tax=Metschnikowia bicuspidata TaxID=27322 RepID=A0A4P9ZH77_9ASCO|nr:hypothetical protein METBISCDRAFT_12337 [Metschnikowia bicuspidata]
MTLQTPNKNVDVLQVPGSSPAAPPPRPEPSAKDREATRKRFHSHVHWPVLRKRFYYLEEAELFKAMMKGKGNLRDTSLWIAENIKLTQRLQEYERREQQQKSRQTAGTDAADFYGPPKTILLHTSELYPSKSDYKSTPAAAASSNDEDALLVKKPGNARQKRVLPSVEAKRPAPDTKVHLLKPKVSILEKYRSRQQPRIDYLFQRLNSLDTKKRKLVRASAGAQSLIPLTGSPGALTAAFGYTGDDIPRLKGSSAAEVDELEILERRIRNNRKNKASRRADSDAELEEEVFSDDMSEEDDPDRPSGAITFIDGQILEFLNQASAQDIIEICNVPPKAAELLIGKRPFITIHEIAEDRLEGATPETEGKRKYQRKPLGLKIVESAESSLKGYKAVDSLVKRCSEYGNLISRQMVRWGVKVTGEGELSVVDVEVQDDEAGEDVKILEEKRRSIPYIKHKPTLLAEDVDLKSYQQVGLNWLHLLYHHKLSCILADEMGLGKTCQVIAFMAHLKAVSADSGPHLVVVPASTLENWLREFQKFCPTLEVQAYYGSQPEREDLRYELAESHFDVLVTTYNLATGSQPDLKFLKSQAFDVIVYDEGHMLKNSNSERYNKLMRLKARFRLLLTGTPLQNNLKELVSLLAFVLPKVFVEKRDDLQVLFNKKASVDATGDFNPLLSQQAINKAKNMMTPFVLRRKKFQVLKHLPGKTHRTIRCDMTAKQREIYDSYISQGKETRLERERRKTMTAKELEGLVPIASTSNVMMALRKAAMHPLLFRTIYTDDTIRTMANKIMNEPEYVSANRGYIVEDMQVMSDYELNALCEKFPSTIGEYVLHRDTWLDSGKTRKLLEVVRAVISKGEKVLVFSLFTQMLDILECVLSFASIAFLRLDGQTSVDTRQDIIDRFYEDASIPVFLLSTKAGGFGINLVAANNVVIFDQSFNPHDDKQAEDRAHRVGQSSEVYVTRLISTNTIDENILMLAENKLQLDHSISNDSASKFEEKAVSMFESILFK